VTVNFRSFRQDGSRSFWLSQLGTLSGVTYSTSFDGGPVTAQIGFEQAVNFDHEALSFGRRIRAYAGTFPVWGGEIDSPLRGQPWAISCQGIASTLAQYAAETAVASQTANIYDLATVIPNATGRGAPFTLPATAYPATGTGPEGSITCDDAMAEAVSQGAHWQMNYAGVITMTNSLPTVPTLVVFPGDTPGGRSGDGYANAVVGQYQFTDGSYHYDGGAGTTPANTAEIARWRRRELIQDLTGLGEITTDQAIGAYRAQLALVGATPPWTSPITVGVGQIFTPAGAPVDPAVVPALPPTLVQVRLVDPDTLGNGQLPQFVIGQAAYDGNTNTVQITPYQSARTDFLAALVQSKRLAVKAFS
jgi:hypothetical protein